MKKKVYLHIPEPCHENWEQMTPVQQGRFCQSCAKQVVDFSNMSDKQILDVLSQAAGKTCGRFTADQLERPVVNEVPTSLKPYKFFLSAFIPAFLLANASSLMAQVKGKAPIHTSRPSVKMGKAGTLSIEQQKITGTVADEKGEPMSAVKIIIKGSTKGTVTNADGQFSIAYPQGYDQVTLEVAFVGYTTKEIEVDQDNMKSLQITFSNKDALTLGEVVVAGYVRAEYMEEESERFLEVPKIEYKGQVVNASGEGIAYASVKLNARKGIVADSNGMFHVYVRHDKKKLKVNANSAGYESYESALNLPADKNDTVKITLKEKAVLEDVVVKCTTTKYLTGKAGAISVIRTVTTKDTAITFIQKLFNNEMFKAFPNPAEKGSDINLTFKKSGNYIIQLFDNSGRLYVQKELVNGKVDQKFSLQLPASVSAGLYYLKATNTSGNKQFIDKLIIL